MTTRRDFVHRGVAVSAVSFAGARAAWGAVRAGPGAELPHSSVPFTSVRADDLLFDGRVEESRAFAAEAGLPGGATRILDVAALGCDQLYHRWKGGDANVAGLTGVSTLFCLEQLGRRHDRRVLLRIDHRPRADGWIEHNFEGPPNLLPAARRAVSLPDWPRRSMQLVQQLPSVGRGFVRAGLGLTPGLQREWAEPLATWVIAPRALVIASTAGS